MVCLPSSLPLLPQTRWFVLLAAQNQSEYPMAKIISRQPSQNLHDESDQTQSALFPKLPTQLNTQNRFAPELVRVSPNVSDGQRLGHLIGSSHRRRRFITWFIKLRTHSSLSGVVHYEPHWEVAAVASWISINPERQRPGFKSHCSIIMPFTCQQGLVSSIISKQNFDII